MPTVKNIKDGLGKLDKQDQIDVKKMKVALEMGYDDPVFFNDYFLGIPTHPGQQDYLRNSDPIWNKESKRKNLLVPCNRWGKEQGVNEPVLTEFGWEKIGDLKIGDKIFSKNGKLTEVIGVYPQGKKQLYKMVFDDGSWTKCGWEHLWKCKNRRERFNYKNEWRIMSTKEIVEYGGYNPEPYKKIEIPVVDPIIFPEKKILLSPYLLGLLLGDGCFLKKSIRFSTADKELLSGFKYRHIKNYDYQISNVIGIIRELGLENKKSWNKFIPKDYLYNSVKNRIAILQGLMDTDGNIESSGKIGFNTVSKELADNVIFIVNSLGGKVIKSIKRTTHRDCYRLRIKIKINPFRLKRKSDRFCITKNTYNRLLKKIIKVEKEDAVCIQVADKSNLYVTRNFIVTHNTVLLATKHIRFCFYKLLMPREEMTVRSMADVRYRTLDLSPHSNQVRACFNYIYDILNNRFIIVIDGKRKTNKCKIRALFKSKNESRMIITFSNNSSFNGASTGEDQAASLAGAQFGLITYDECVFSHHLREELPGRIMSRTVDLNAPIDLVATFDRDANGQQFFFGLAKKALAGKNEWYIKTGVYTDNVFIPLEIKEASKAKIMAEDFNLYRQVFLGEAIPSSVKLFEPEVVDQVFKEDLNPERPQVGHDYLISVDWGGSEQGDPTIMMVIDYSGIPYRVVHHEEIKGGSPHANFALLKALKFDYNDANIIMDTNSLGGVIIKKILNDMKVRTYDFDAHGGEKGEALTQLRLMLTRDRRAEIIEGKLVDHNKNFGMLRSYYIGDLEDQLGMYQIDDKKIEQDYVAALWQAAWWLMKKYRKQPEQTYLLNRNRRGKNYATIS